MKLFRKIAALCLAGCLLLPCGCSASGGKNENDQNNGNGQGGNSGVVAYDESLRVEDTRTLTPEEFTIANLSATDDFGRFLFTVDGKENKDRYVGMFFFLWLGQHGDTQRGIYDCSEITQNGTDLDAFQVNDDTSPVGAAHFWGEPVWGYYSSTDEWVMRKQVEMLTLAGVDFLVFDVTNGFTYPTVTSKLFRVLKEYQDAGWNVPKCMYYVAAESTTGQCLNTLKEVYHHFYEDETYKSLWFAPDGKPIITLHENYYYAQDFGLDLNDPEEKAIHDLFQFRCRQWPNESFNEDGIPWMEFTPNIFNRFQPVHNGWMNVSVGQHVGAVRFSDTVSTQGRGFDHILNRTDHDRYREDLNYISQWQTVLDNKDEVRFTFLTGWNEWVATKMRDEGGTYFTVDTFIPEFSRDLEPSVNLGDNSYLLTAQKIRENNYTQAKHYRYSEYTMSSAADGQWGNVNRYVDFTNDCLDRDAYAMAGRKHYTDNSGRNDISSVQVAHDKNYLYFRVETAEDVTPYEEGDAAWMNLWLNTRAAGERYMGYNYVIRRSGEGADVCSVQGGELVKTASADLAVEGKEMFVRVARSALNMTGADYDFEFKVTDNVKQSGKYLDFYRTGDSAPIGRLNYHYGY